MTQSDFKSPSSISLTPHQKAFLESYFEDILFDRGDFLELTDAEMTQSIRQMDFDDAMPSNPGKLRVAGNLNELGIFEDYDAHNSPAGRHIYISFNETGAALMTDLIRKAAAEGRLPPPDSSAPSP